MALDMALDMAALLHLPTSASTKAIRMKAETPTTTAAGRPKMADPKPKFHHHLELRGLNTSSLVLIVNNLNVAFAAHNNWALAVDGIWNDVKDALDLAFEHTRGGDSTSLLGDHGHGDSLVQTAELALGGLIVRRVKENASVEESAVDIGNHRTDVTGGVGLGSLLEDGNGLLDGLVPVIVITFVARKNGLASVLGELHVDTSVHELTDGGVEAEAVNSATLEGEDKLDGRTVDTVSGADTLRTRTEKIIDGSLGSLLLLEDTENGTDRNVAVNVTGSIEGVEGDAVLTGLLLGDDDGILLLLRNEHGANSRVDESVDHHVIGHDVELLLIIAGAIYLTSKAIELRNACPLDSRGNKLAGSSDGVEKDHKLVIMSVGHDEPVEGRGVLHSSVEIVLVGTAQVNAWSWA
jgi:hypothetical protein